MIWLEADKAQEIVVGPFVDFSDGVTPETGIAEVGTPGWDDATIRWIKWAAGVPTVTTITDVGSGDGNEISELSDGYYKIKLTAANLDTEGPCRIAFRDEDHFGPVWHDVMVQTANAYQHHVLGTASLADITTVLARLGPWSGSGVNTILGAFKAALAKSSSLPSDIGGTFAATTDANEALRDRLDVVAAGSTLATILAALESMGQRLGISQTVSTTSDLTLRSGGYLGRVFALIRQTVNEPTVLAKYKDSDLLSLVIVAWPQIWADLKLTADNVPIVDVALEINTTDLIYQLPAGMGELRSLSKVNSDNGHVEWVVFPRADDNPWGYGIRIEGPTLALSSKWDAAYSLVLSYVPDGEVAFHEGQGAYSDDADGNVRLFTTDTGEDITGKLDMRQNAYAGQILRTFATDPSASEIVEERLITGYDAGVFTISPKSTAFEAGAAKYAYEVIPQLGRLMESVLGLNAARRIHVAEGNTKLHALATRQYVEDIRAVRLRLSKMMGIRPHRQQGDVRQNKHFGRGLVF